MSFLNGKQIKNSTLSLNKLNGTGVVTFTSATVSFGIGSRLLVNTGNNLSPYDVVNVGYFESEVSSINSGIRGDISDLESSIDSMESLIGGNLSFSGVDASIDSLEIQISNVISTNLEEFELIELINSSQNTSIDSLEAQLSFIVDNSDPNALDSLREIVDYFNSIDQDFRDNLNEVVGFVDTSIDSLESQILGVDTSIDSLENQLSGVLSANISIDSLESQILGVNTSIDSLEILINTELSEVGLSISIDSLELVDSIQNISIESIEIAISNITTGDFSSKFEVETFTIAPLGLTYNVSTLIASNDPALVTVFVNGIFVETSSVDGTQVVLVNPGYIIEPPDKVVIKYIK
jgi:hypothetical protein